ncbi:hypothetical protein Tco_1094246 [Tanacetum coccineum]|uniref:Uncharacterized protein n=1 Tax=Tanacetum coccineum TaxID=301880 RepID=A0ABQ5IF10_9ASTR
MSRLSTTELCVPTVINCASPPLSHSRSSSILERNTNLECTNLCCNSSPVLSSQYDNVYLVTRVQTQESTSYESRHASPPEEIPVQKTLT